MCPRDEAALAECLKDGLNVYIPELATGMWRYIHNGDICTCLVFRAQRLENLKLTN